MKRYIIILISIGLLGTSCTDQLKELNVNPNSPSSISPGPLLSYIQLHTAQQTARRSSVGFCMMMMQQLATLKTDDLEGDKYLKSLNEGILFNDTYSIITPSLSTLLSMAKDDPDQTNTYWMAVIWKVLVYSRVADIYGDIPYSQAGKGFIDDIYNPVYDSQEDIYYRMLHQLDSATQHLDASLPTVGDADVIYQGNIDQWKKLANSLMLRLGMHLNKVDPTAAAQWAQKAFNNGVITENTDNCLIQHANEYDEDQANPIAFFFEKFNLLSKGDIKISKTFLDYLIDTKDPRLSVYCSLPDGDNTPADQKGLPNGYDATSISGYAGGDDLSSYSTFNTQYILSYDAPTFLVTAAETQLLLAEAKVRSYISAGEAVDYYEDAVTATMEQMAAYGATISSADIASYKTENPYPITGSSDDQIKAIANQYWVSSFLDGYATYDNWRRTGYPKLTPVNYDGNASNGTIPRRLSYPQGEYSANPENIEAAVSHQGPDNYTTRVWWDVKP